MTVSLPGGESRVDPQDILDIRQSGLFDEAWYLETYPDVAALGMDPVEHYLWLGARLGRDPSPDFTTRAYVESHAGELDGVNPLLHAVHGGTPARASTRPAPSPSHGATRDPAKPLPPEEPLSDVSAPELRQIAEVRQHFDADYYLANNPDLAGAGIDPVRHYLEHGWKEGRNPHPDFDTAWYLRYYRDVAESGINPFVHYVRYGRKEGRGGKEPSYRIQKSDAFLRGFEDFSQFLSESIINDTLLAPFKEEDRRVFATMEKIRKELCRTARSSATRPLVSIVMPAFNREDVIADAITSVLAQSYPAFELIVVDDGSSDETAGAVRAFSDARIRLIETGVNRGAGAARNIGLEAARGDFITYLDSDNTMHRDFLLAMLGAFIKLPKADMCYCGQLLFQSGEASPYGVRFAAYSPALVENRNSIDMNTIMHTRAVLGRVSGFDEGLKRLVDWDFVLRAAETLTIYSVPALLSNYRVGFSKGTSITASQDLDTARREIRRKQAERTAARQAQYTPAFRKGITVVVPSYQALEALKACVESFFADAAADNVDIVIVDNASDAPVRDYLRSLESNARVRIVLNDTNYGFTHAVNQGIAIAHPDRDIVLLNNDARLVPGALMALQACALESDDTAIAVPRQILPAHTQTMIRHVPSAHEGYECDVTLSWHHRNVARVPCFHDGQRVELTFAPFFCVYIRREALDAVGGLDAEFGRHYRSDQVFCAMVRNYHGKKIVYTPHAHVYHLHQKATDQLRRTSLTQFDEMLQKNRWSGRLQRELSFERAPWDYSLDDPFLPGPGPKTG